MSKPDLTHPITIHDLGDSDITVETDASDGFICIKFGGAYPGSCHISTHHALELCAIITTFVAENMK